MRWVLLDQTAGAKTSGGEAVTPAALSLIAQAVTAQMNRDYGPECGGEATVVRAGASATDIQPGERVFSFLAALPNAPGDVAYHSIDGNGVPYALLAITSCDTLLGAGNSASVSVSHEVIETAGDPGCNRYADDLAGKEHAVELCDPVEVQAYPITVAGTPVYVSNFVLPTFFTPLAAGPYSYMAKAGIAGAVDPPGPMQIASGGGGNYEVERTSPASSTPVFGMHERHVRVHGCPRNAAKVAHWSSRVSRRGAVL